LVVYVIKVEVFKAALSPTAISLNWRDIRISLDTTCAKCIIGHLLDLVAGDAALERRQSLHGS